MFRRKRGSEKKTEIWKSYRGDACTNMFALYTLVNRVYFANTDTAAFRGEKGTNIVEVFD
jgi:hypothetical protein